MYDTEPERYDRNASHHEVGALATSRPLNFEVLGHPPGACPNCGHVNEGGVSLAQVAIVRGEQRAEVKCDFCTAYHVVTVRTVQ